MVPQRLNTEGATTRTALLNAAFYALVFVGVTSASVEARPDAFSGRTAFRSYDCGRGRVGVIALPGLHRAPHRRGHRDTHPELTFNSVGAHSMEGFFGVLVDRADASRTATTHAWSARAQRAFTALGYPWAIPR